MDGLGSGDSIRDARRVELPPLLRREGYILRELGGGNHELRDHPGIIVKHCFWRCPDTGRAGNATCPKCCAYGCRRVDLFTRVLGHSFTDTMRIITRA